MNVASPDAPAKSRLQARMPAPQTLYSLLVAMVSFWALNFVIGKIALRELPPLLLAAVRTAIAGAVMLAIFVLRRRHRPGKLTVREMLTLVLLGVFGSVLGQVFFAAGLSKTSVTHSAILTGLTPVQVLLLAAVIGQEKLTWRKASGMAVALAGVCVLQLARNEGGAAPSLTGDVLILLSGFAFAAYSVFGKRVSERHDTVTINTFAYAGGAIALSPVIFWQAGRFDFAAVSAGAWLGVTYMAVCSSVASYLIFNYVLKHIAASRVSAFSYLLPLLVTLIAIPVLHEPVTTSLLIGGALVLAGVYVTERG
jgi:drug/metabolite transporter (DMT)-like permease